MKFRNFVYIYFLAVLLFSCNKKKENNIEDVTIEDVTIEYSNIETNMLFTDNLLKDVIYNGNITLLDKLMNPQQLINLNLDELRILRNTIYARYNYKFYSNDLREHFSQFSWYNINKNYSEKYLTYLDHKNIKLIMDLENNFPLFIPYTDKRIYDFGLNYNIENRKIIILGWSVDGKILFWERKNLYIYDLKENIRLDTGYEQKSLYDVENSIGQKEWIDKVVEVAEKKYNILPIVDNIHTNIIGYRFYSKNILKKEYPKKEWYLHCWEIGLNSTIDNNISIELINYHFINAYLTKKYDEPLTENDIIYFCIQNPFDENIIVLITIFPCYRFGDINRNDIYYKVIGIDMNKLEIEYIKKLLRLTNKLFSVNDTRFILDW